MRGISALLGAAALLVALLFPATGSAVTVGAPLGADANAESSCQGLALVGVPPSCTIFGSDAGGAWTSQTPRGSWRITKARVRTGPNVGPMAFSVIRVLRSQAGSPASGAICCTVPAESAVFTPAPNTVNELTVNLPAVNTVEDVNGEPVEVVDYLGISMLNLNSTLPVHRGSGADPAASASFTAFIPAIRLGQQALQFGGFPESTVLVNGEYEQAATTLGPEPVAPEASLFRLLPGFRLLRGGTRARLGANVPGAGLLRAFAPQRRGGARVSKAGKRRGKAKGKRRKPRLLIPARRRVSAASKAYIVVKLTRLGKRRLNRRGKLTVPVRLVFKPAAGATVRRTKAVAFRKPRAGKRGKKNKKKAKASAARPAAGPRLAKCGKRRTRAAKRACRKQNKANRIAFNQIKDSKFVGERGDGEAVDNFYCGNGRWESRLTGRYGTGISTGRRWWIKDAVVRRGGKWIDAFLGGTGGYEVALQRRGTQWRYGIASFDRILEPGDVTRSSAAADC